MASSALFTAPRAWERPRALLLGLLLASNLACSTAELGEEDAVALLQGTAQLQHRRTENANALPSFLTLPLRKQYVPIIRNNAVIAYKTSYFGQIQAGTPERQTFTVVFDTGSGHVILPSLGCQSETCAKHRRFNRSASATAIDIEHNGRPIPPSARTRDQLKISFGSGEVVGEFVRDTVCLGNEESRKACAELRLVIAKDMSEDPFGLFEFDGVLGLGLGALALNPHFSLFGQMVAQHPELLPHFSVFLARDDTGRSAVSVGGHDPRWAASDIQWAPVAMPELGYWQVQIKSVLIGSTELPDCAAGGCRAILDTGTSLLGVPKQASRTMHRQLARPVPGEHDAPERSAADCRRISGQQMHFELVSGAIVSLGEEDYSRPKPINMTAPGLKDGWDLFCRSLLLPVDMKPPMGPLVFIWGEPVLRRYLTVYDWTRQRVGFALAGSYEAEDLEGATPIGAPPEGSLVAGVPLASGQAGQSSGPTPTTA